MAGEVGVRGTGGKIGPRGKEAQVDEKLIGVAFVGGGQDGGGFRARWRNRVEASTCDCYSTSLISVVAVDESIFS
jgi:hypothetical protein